MRLYDTDSVFFSRCALPQNSNAVVGSDLVWSGYWEGYFFVDCMDGTCRLMFWDVNAACEGDDLQMLPLGENQQSQIVVEASLYERAAQLSRRFGVDIRIAEQCSLDYSHYDSYAMTYPTEDRATLMETAIENYTWDFEPDSGRRAKMQYYADCIRDCFDTTGWPEITLWEQVSQ